MAMSAEQRSKFAAFHRQWWRLHMSEKFSTGTNKQTKTITVHFVYQHFMIKRQRSAYKTAICKRQTLHL